MWLKFACATLSVFKATADAKKSSKTTTSTTKLTQTSSSSSTSSRSVSQHSSTISGQQSSATADANKSSKTTTSTTKLTQTSSSSSTASRSVSQHSSTISGQQSSGSGTGRAVMASVIPTVIVLIVVFFIVLKRKTILKQFTQKQEKISNVNNTGQSFHNGAYINHDDMFNDSSYADIPLDNVNVSENVNAYSEYQTIDCVADETPVISTDYGHLKVDDSVSSNNTYEHVDSIFKHEKGMAKYSHLQIPIETTKDKTKHCLKTNTAYDKLGMKSLIGKELHSSKITDDDGSMYNHTTAVGVRMHEDTAGVEADNYSHINRPVNHGTFQGNTQRTEETRVETNLNNPCALTLGEQNDNDIQNKASHDYFILDPTFPQMKDAKI